MSILVICPSRGRPQAAREAASSLVATRQLGDTKMLVAVDDDDPLVAQYALSITHELMFLPPQDGKMVGALNRAVELVLGDREDEDVDIIGFIGDDHRFRTPGWDVVITKALEQPGFAYGYDLFWHEGQIPTQVFISRQIVEALGYFALPDCHHLFVDNAWKALGDATDSIHWIRDVVVEHLHPAIGKAEWDEGYKRVNSTEMYGHDQAAFEGWLNSPRFREDVAKVRAVLA